MCSIKYFLVKNHSITEKLMSLQKESNLLKKIKITPDSKIIATRRTCFLLTNCKIA